MNHLRPPLVHRFGSAASGQAPKLHPWSSLFDKCHPQLVGEGEDAGEVGGVFFKCLVDLILALRLVGKDVRKVLLGALWTHTVAELRL
jgi:hypothetical protein